ncbi:hypothetical protein Nepgr_004966 [Nepenthes gracilis]|uniref:Uncharacterized protein n=1 Tax=Nepenthes gracilis TaxID=150966 RepID=A0AAD3S2D2_NEPGR|nr:hypothetical protein Nepgr_004966 [Nepenthes gracilis]
MQEEGRTMDLTGWAAALRLNFRLKIPPLSIATENIKFEEESRLHYTKHQIPRGGAISSIGQKSYFDTGIDMVAMVVATIMKQFKDCSSHTTTQSSMLISFFKFDQQIEQLKLLELSQIKIHVSKPRFPAQVTFQMYLTPYAYVHLVLKTIPL